MGRRKKKEAGNPDLTPLELELMRVIWERGNATAAEVAAALKPERQLADTTIHTVLANLRKKGFIEPIPTVERSFRYEPVVPREKVAERSVRRLLYQFFESSPRRLMAHLIDSEEIDEAEVKELRRLLESKGEGRKE